MSAFSFPESLLPLSSCRNGQQGPRLWDKAFSLTCAVKLEVQESCVRKKVCVSHWNMKSNTCTVEPEVESCHGWTLYPRGPCCPFLPLDKGNEDSGNKYYYYEWVFTWHLINMSNLQQQYWWKHKQPTSRCQIHSIITLGIFTCQFTVA